MTLLANIQRMVAEGADYDSILELVDSHAQSKSGRIRHADGIDVEGMRSDTAEREATMYALLKSLEISSAPETIATFPCGTMCIVVRNYWACPNERLIKLEDSGIPLRPDAKARFGGDMNRLFDHGKLYPYIRGDAHWLVSEKTGVIVLAPWLLIDASPRKREEHFESIERTFARHS
jgi:hypothetical protein